MAPVGHLLRSVDFERVLATSPRARSTHFALHHLPARPSPTAGAARRAAAQAVAAKLSTAGAPTCPPPVDDAARDGSGGHWLGTVVPKRHARRAVTRNLLKRQMRAQIDAHADRLAGGLWVLRLKSPFDVKQYPSAASAALRATARAELQQLIGRAIDRAGA